MFSSFNLFKSQAFYLMGASLHSYYIDMCLNLCTCASHHYVSIFCKFKPKNRVR